MDPTEEAVAVVVGTGAASFGKRGLHARDASVLMAEKCGASVVVFWHPFLTRGSGGDSVGDAKEGSLTATVVETLFGAGTPSVGFNAASSEAS